MSGIFGAVSTKSGKSCITDLFFGTDYNSHMGDAFTGLAIPGLKPDIHRLTAQFKSKFEGIIEEDGYKDAEAGIGVISADEEQPLEVYSNFGKFSICADGRIGNLEELTQKLFAEGHSFSQLGHSKNVRPNSIELAGKIIAQEQGIIPGIEKLMDMITGSLSILLVNDKRVYAARSKYGQSPLMIGIKKDALAVTGESCAFNNLGFKPMKELKSGEIVLLTQDGLKQKKEGNGISKICAFLWVYTGYPASNYEGINVEVARYECGRALARRDMEDENFKPDFAAGVPDSGIAHAIGYSNEAKLPFKRPLVKYNDGYGRSYIPPTQEERELVAQMKLIAIEAIANEQSMVLMEDSIVRGTQLKSYTLTKLKDAGAREVHVRPACPPLMFPCPYNVSTKAMPELITRRMIKELEGTMEPDNIEKYLDPDSPEYKRMINSIAEDIGVTSLRYQRCGDMVKAIGMPADKVCTYCWTGKQVK